MNHWLKKVAVVALPLAVLPFGCATTGVNLVESGAVQIKIPPTVGAHISGNPKVYREGDHLVVAGTVITRPTSSSIHLRVEAKVSRPDGARVASARSEDLGRPGPRGPSQFPFRIELSGVPPPGPKLEVSLAVKGRG